MILINNALVGDVEDDDGGCGGVDNGGDVGTNVQVVCTAKCIRPREHSVLKAVVQVCMDR